MYPRLQAAIGRSPRRIGAVGRTMSKSRDKQGRDGSMPVESPRRVALATLGCKVNQCESAAMADRLTQLGHTVVGFDADADVFIINTCTVTARTDFQSRQLVRRAARRNPGAPVIVTGCYAQVAPDLLKELPNVRLVAGNVEKELIPGLVGTLNGGPADVFVRDIGQARQFSVVSPPIAFPGGRGLSSRSRTGAMPGAATASSPKARGPSRSMPKDRVLERVRIPGRLGLSRDCFHRDPPRRMGAGSDPVLGHAIAPAPDRGCGADGRLRLSSIEPMEVTDELIACLRDSTWLCRHLHIPLQSGDDRILAAMGRHYDREFFRERIERLVSEIPDLAIGVDVMAGFPGEGDHEFENTMALLRELPVAYLHVFPYSERPGTAASGMPGKVEESVRAARAAVLRGLGLAKRKPL